MSEEWWTGESTTVTSAVKYISHSCLSEGRTLQYVAIDWLQIECITTLARTDTPYINFPSPLTAEMDRPNFVTRAFRAYITMVMMFPFFPLFFSCWISTDVTYLAASIYGIWSFNVSASIMAYPHVNIASA